MDDGYVWITKNGNRIKIKNKQSPMDAFIRQTSKKKRKQTQAKKKISKEHYSRLAHIVNTYPKKFKVGFNTQIIDDRAYIFVYNGYDSFDIVKSYKFKG